MPLLQISDPTIEENTIPKHNKYALGIDFGTTNSLVAMVDYNSRVTRTATVFKNEDADTLLPSIVHYSNNKPPIVGVAAAQLQLTDPANTITSVKRLLAKKLSDIKPGNYPYKFTQQEAGILEIITSSGIKNPVQIASQILIKLKQIAEHNLQQDNVNDVVLTVPAYFDAAAREAIKQAAVLAGLNVLRLLSEPTAAAIAYGLDSQTEGTFLVYDLGGGTLDVSILRLNRGVFEILAVNGNANLGGDDFDYVLYQYLLEQTGTISNDPLIKQQTLVAARKCKESLSNQQNVPIDLQFAHGLTIDQDMFTILTKPLIEKALKPIKHVLRDAKLDVSQIDEVILVGGATRMPHLRAALNNFFTKPVLTDINPEHIVVIGAAIEADMLVGNCQDNWLLLDVTPLSLGIETMGNLVEKIIPRNSTLPTIISKDFTTHVDRQTAMSIHVLQGERELASECRSLAKFSFKGIPPLAQGLAKIRITFQLDADGLLTVSAYEQTTDQTYSVTIKPSFGLTEEQISSMLNDSITNADTDMQLRLLNEAIINANNLTNTIAKLIANNRNLISDDEFDKIQNILTEINLTINQDEKDINKKTNAINELTKTLDVATKKFANLAIDQAINSQLVGKVIS